MIQIIEPGKKLIVQCDNCGCKFSYEGEDIQQEPEYKAEDLWIYISKKYVVCPQCGKRVFLSSTSRTDGEPINIKWKIPEWWKDGPTCINTIETAGGIYGVFSDGHGVEIKLIQS